MIGLGHREIAFLTFSENWRVRGLGPSMCSLRGFNLAVDRFHVSPVYRECQLEVERAYCATSQLCSQHPRLTAFVAMHNTLAVGAIRALHDLHRDVPEKSSIVGVALGKEAELVIPPLTAVDFSGHDVGRQAARMLIQELNGRRETHTQVLVRPQPAGSPQYVAREIGVRTRRLSGRNSTLIVQRPNSGRARLS